MDRRLDVATTTEPPSLVELIARGALDAELGALVWTLVAGSVPLVVAAPPDRLGAAAQLLSGVLASVRPDAAVDGLTEPLSPTRARRIVRGQRAGGIVAGRRLEDVFETLGGGPLSLAPDELTFLGCVLVLGAVGSAGPSPVPAGSTSTEPTRGRLRVLAAHYVRPLARDAHGHAQRLDPAVLATWDSSLGEYEHFAWGVLPEIAARLGRRAGDLEADLHHRRDDLAGLARAGVTRLDEVRRLIAGYQVGYGGGHGGGSGTDRPH
ncbi:MAG TPA: hypothetical protein VKR30_08190 [Candidatus Limnocylindrales bacterium]|nr:hypothetical protein [Candidatus Limnocylindrales bacterium]